MRSSTPDKQDRILLSQLAASRCSLLYITLLLFIATAICCLFIVIPVPHPLYHVILSVLGLLLLVLMVFFIVRTLVVFYRYVLTDQAFLVSRLLLRRERCVIRLPLASISEMGHPANGLPRGRRYNACPAQAPVGRCLYVLSEQQGKRTVILLAPTEAFADALNRAVLDAKTR